MTPELGDANARDAGVVEEICGLLTEVSAKSFFLFAGAGSGKTRTLVEVLRRLTGVVEHGSGAGFAERLRARGQSIRVITYTRNAVAVINGRLGENDLARVSTIHSFCWEMIAGYDHDIREALLALNSEEIEQTQQKAAARKRGPTANDITKIAELRKRAATLATISKFEYSPDRNTHGEGALQHAQVLSVTAWLLENRPTLRRILADKHPVVLIDESQDTMKGMLAALMSAGADESSRFTLGLVGDHRQRIYTDGHQDLPGLIPENWARPKLEMNHRSQQRIVELINRIWEADLEGRTQPRSGVRQYSRTEKPGGCVRIFIGDTTLDPEEKTRRESLCADAMAVATQNETWSNRDGYQVLALEHRLAAQRGRFVDVFAAMDLIDPEAVRPRVSGDAAGPVAVQLLLREIPALKACMDEHGRIDEFGAIDVLNHFGRLRGLPLDVSAQQARLAELHNAVMEFAAAWAKPGPTVREILEPVVRYQVFDLDHRLVHAFGDTTPLPPVPERPADEPEEERRRRGWHGLFGARWDEVERYRDYLEGRSNVATHQVVKGSEFEQVMVVMDDEAATGNLFSYDKVFGAASLTKADLENVTKGNETSIDRTLRLLYVTCSRAKDNLALVLWSRDPEAALRSISAGGWFSPAEVARVPEC